MRFANPKIYCNADYRWTMALQCFTILCSLLGRHHQALHQAEMAVEFDTLDPTTNFHLVQSSYFAGRFEQRVKSGYNALELAPEFPYTRWYVAWSLLALGRREEAWQMALDTRPLDNQSLNEGRFGYIATVVERRAEALAVLRELETRRELRYSPALPIAWIYLGLGDTNTCLEWFPADYCSPCANDSDTRHARRRHSTGAI